MRIAIINEVSTQQKNGDILKALGDRGYKVMNLGMTGDSTLPELTYIHTSLMTAILLNTGAADFVVGGCGTGQGYMNAVLQYPGVFCGLVSSALDAWLFTQINGGNCISLPLNQGYGWAADVNLRFIFDRIFRRAAAAILRTGENPSRSPGLFWRRSPAQLTGRSLRFWTACPGRLWSGR